MREFVRGRGVRWLRRQLRNRMLNNLPVLGAGIGFREPYRGDLFLNRRAVDFLEITVDHFFDAAYEKAAELKLLANHFTLIPHGLNLSLGSADGLDDVYLEKFAQVVQQVRPPYWSEHIAFTRAGGVQIGHLTPLPFTREAIEVFCANVARARERIPVPLILENITYTFQLPGAEMSEGEFLTEILERTDAGLLLDVTNLHTNAVNHRFAAERFLDEIPCERIVQLHFAGGFEDNGTLIDSHSRPTPPDVWALLEKVLARAPVKGVILERDEELPPFQELAEEVARARELGRKYQRWD